MSSLNERKAKSLNDIPMVFKKRDINNTGSKTYRFKVSLANVLDEEPQEKDEFHSEKDISNESKFLEARKISKEENEKEEFSKESNVSTISIEQRFDNVSKIGALDPSSFVNSLLEDENLKDEHKFRDILEMTLGEKKRVLSFIDVFLSLALITPLTVGFWRGIWTLMDIHADIFPGVFTFISGISIHTSFAVLKNLLHARMLNAWKKKTPLNKFFCKSTQILYTYIFGAACNMQWRGGWIIYDHFFADHVWTVIGTLLLELALLVIIRAVRNLIAIPSVLAVDKLVFVFRFPTRYQSNTRDWSLYLLDCAFSVGVVGTLVVFVWRGVWILVDLYLFPGDRKYSAIGSLAIGYVIVTVTFSLQSLMRYVCARLQGFARLIAADSFLLLSFLGTVNVWRGIWNVLDLWLLPENPELSCWITHIGCFVLLVLLNCSNSILVRGVYIDAEEDDGKCVAFPCHYLRLFFKVEREKKEARRRNLLVASKDFRPRPDGNTKDTENGALLPNSNPATILPTHPESLV